MKTIISFKRSLGLVLAALAIISLVSSMSSAQTTYKRGVLVEEFTGTWCGYCPNGAWFMDSLQEALPDNAIEICWHNNDQMTIGPVEDTIEAYSGLTGYPSIMTTRSRTDVASDWPNLPMFNNIKSIAKTAPTVDLRIVNVAYDPNSHVLDLDLDVTPYDMSKMQTEDTEEYRTLAVLTEDGLVFDQNNYSLRGLPDPIPGYVHYNVARAVGGSVRGDKVILGTQDPAASLPMRTHYSFNIDYNNWNAGKLRAKLMFTGINILTVKDSKGKIYHVENNNILGAVQTKDISTYPSSAPDAEWIVLPNANSTTSPTAPTNIVWAHGGNTSNTAKLEWSGDNGTTWNQITANTTNSPYSWTIPVSAYGMTVIVRATDVANPSVKGVSDPFKTPGIMHITHPAAGDVLESGTKDSIEFTGGNITNSKKLEYSTDSMATWQSLGNVNSNLMYTYITVPTVSKTSTACFIRVTDANNVAGLSGQFTIKAQTVQPGSITSVTATRMYGNPDSIAVGDHSKISWTSSGNIGQNVNVFLSLDGGLQWQSIGTVTSDLTSFDWNPIPNEPTNEAMLKVQGDLPNSTGATFGPFTIYTTEGVLTSSFGGYSITNFPNPAASATTISFKMENAGRAVIAMRDALGRTVATVADGTFGEGQHDISFDASKLATGMYTITFESNGVRLVKTMNVVK